MLKNKNILIVDDDPIIRNFLSDFLIMEGAVPLTISDGDSALKAIEEYPDLSAVILDWVLPDISGLDVLRIMKERNKTSKLPVIMQTGSKDRDKIIAGIESGAFYFLTKPYDFKILSTILKRAVHEYESQQEISQTERNEKSKNFFSMLSKGVVRFRTVKEAMNLASMFGGFLNDEKFGIGLIELLVNAVEHGNLGIGFEKKEELIMNDLLSKEIENRLNHRDYKDRFASLEFEKTVNEILIRISDEGDGFDYKQYSVINPERVLDVNGRGVAISKMIFHDDLQYLGKGNVLEIRISC